ncbi:MAG: asparaginase [Bacteroidales bacterium]|jgi:L-asparaginase|nr:asparaginase [Bacteroidales bacterium]
MVNKILLIYTGGTIGMEKNEQGALIPMDFSDLITQIPALKQLGVEINTFSFSNPIDSSNIEANFWQKIAKTVIDNYEEYCGFVILHGTDTMAYTSSILSFMLQGLNKPVVLTGSQLPLSSLRTDGRANLITAVEIAAASALGKLVVPEVCLCFEQTLYRGNRITKHYSDKFNAFMSHSYPPLARVGTSIFYDRNHFMQASDKLKTYLQLDNRIKTIRLHPCLRETVFDQVDGEDIRAIILQSYGTGNAPTFPGFLKKIEEAIEKGIIIANISQCPGGFVDMGIYQTSRHMQEIGVLDGSDLTEEAAFTKLMHLLGTYDDTNIIKQLFEKNIAGEMSNRLD